MIKSLRGVLVSIVVVSGIYAALSPALAHGDMGGMGGMMGRGMTAAPDGSNEPAPITVNPSQARELSGYVQSQHLQCMQCHAVSKSSIAPSFSVVSARYAHRKDAVQVLSENIAHGIGRMPPGLANKQQAHDLAKLILGLVEESNKSGKD